MTSNQQSQGEHAPPPTHDSQQAELFAASAAEGAVTHRKDPSLADQLDQLSVSAVHPPSPPRDPIDQSASPNFPEPPTSTNTDTAKHPEPPVLSKEKLVEEALNCPCVAPLREGACGDPFMAAFKCFLESDTEPRGMNCYDLFKTMQTCLAEHPEEYNLDDDDDDDTDPFAAQIPDPSRETSSAPTPASPTNSPSDRVPSSPSSSL